MQGVRRPFYLRNQPSLKRSAGTARRRGGPVSTLATIAWSTIAAVAAWGLTLAYDTAAWAAGCKQGREDVMMIMPLLVAAHQRLMERQRAAADMADSA